MGMKGRQIVERAGLDVDKLLNLLNKAYCDEWLAYYQYWVGAKIAEGVLAGPIAAEMMEHAKEELEHAGKLAGRISQLDGKPILNPAKKLQSPLRIVQFPQPKHTMYRILSRQSRGRYA